MELLHMIPISWMSFVVHGLLVTGILLLLISFFGMNLLESVLPVIKPYTKMLQILSIVVLTAGVYLKGGYEAELIWHKQVAELEEKVKIATIQSEKVNTVVEQQVITKIKEVKVQSDQIIKYIDREVIKYDDTCVIPPSAIKAHNAAAENIPIDD